MFYRGSQVIVQRKRKQPSYHAGPARRTRLIVYYGVALVWSSMLVWRLYTLQISNHSKWQDWALRQHFQEVQLASERGPIYDRSGNLMAVSVPAGSVYVRPRQVKDRTQTISELSSLLNMKASEIDRKLSTDQPFVWINRQIPRSVAEKAEALKLPGVGYMLESRRFYPYNNAASSLIGKVGIDGTGLSGLEAVFEDRLHIDQLKTKMVRDALGNKIDVSYKPTEKFQLPKGSDLNLTLNADIQLIVDEELEKGRQAAKAQNAMAVMIDADTGEILALSQAPSTNLNSNRLNAKKDLKNHIIETVFEPGSIFKPLVAAAAIEEGLTTPKEMINCEKGNFYFGSHRINDVHPSDVISLSDVIIRSSNIGISKIGIRMGADKLYSYLEKFGFKEKSLDLLPGETRGILRPVEKWAKIDIATHSYGQGIAVTPLQILRATAVIANGGKLPKLHVVKGDEIPPAERVVSEATAKKVKEMMYGVVTDEHGTGKNAGIPGVLVGGKTGTAQKARKDGKGYMPGAYIASFVGFVDASAINIKKNLALIVVVDEPNNGKSIYGGTLAAPVFRSIVLRTLHYLTTKTGISEPKNGKTMPMPEVVQEEPKVNVEDEIVVPPTNPSLVQVSFNR